MGKAFLYRCCVTVCCIWMAGPAVCRAADTACVRVKADVSFADENPHPVPAGTDPDPATALLFFRPKSMENIDDVSGTDTVNPSNSTDTRCLTVPPPGSSRGLESVTLYHAGTKLTHIPGGEQKVTEATPDDIAVKPMSENTQEYYPPSDVYVDALRYDFKDFAGHR